MPDRVAFFTDARGWGGAEVYLMQLMARARAAGVEPHVFCADRPEVDAWLDELARLGYAVERYRGTKEFNPVGFFAAWRRLAGYELVHFNKTHPRNSLPAIVAARARGAKAIVATEHIVLPTESHFPFGRRIITFLVRCTNRLIDRTIAVSESSRELLIRNYGLDPSKVVVIRNGIDVSAFGDASDVEATRADLGLGPADRVAVLVGRFTGAKGHRSALAAIKRVRATVPAARLVFVGDGARGDGLRSRAERLGVSDAVVFAGFRRDVPRVLAASDLLILPSEGESLPLTVLEAMATGLPVVATDVGGIGEAVEDGVTGILVKPGDTDGLARAMAEILGDAGRARAMGDAGLRRVEREFGMEACASAVFELYAELLDRKGH